MKKRRKIEHGHLHLRQVQMKTRARQIYALKERSAGGFFMKEDAKTYQFYPDRMRKLTKNDLR